MNQQIQGSSSQSNVPMKRKRGRPRKQDRVVQEENVPVMPGSDNALNPDQRAPDDCVDEMLGKAVTGVIEGAFNSGYLLKVKVVDTDTILKGLAFLPDQVAPVTAENDVAPHLKMIKRKDIQIPVLNPQTEIHGSGPSSGQCSKQSFQPELPVPMSEEQVLPTQSHSGISVPLENQSASTLIPMADLPKNETSISSGGNPQGISEPGHLIQSASIISEMDCDKTAKQGETLHKLDASPQVKDSSADEGATKDSEPASEPINPVPTIENTDKELRTGQQAVPTVDQVNVIHHEPDRSNIELNQIPEPESMPSEQSSKSVDNFMENQALPKTDVLEDTTTNALDVGSNQALETSQPESSHPESMPSEQIEESATSESKFSS